MEIVNYTNFKVDPEIYGTNIIAGLLDKTGNYLYESLYDIRPAEYNPNLPAKLVFFFKFANKKLLNSLLSDFEISKETLNRPFRNLSSSELIKILTIDLLLSNAKTIVFNSIDTFLNYKDLERLLKITKTYLRDTDKTVIFTTNKIENILLADKYIIAENGSIIYNDTNLKTLPIIPETIAFARLANKKGAKLDYYKDASDLLKAIYRSVK